MFFDPCSDRNRVNIDHFETAGSNLIISGNDGLSWYKTGFLALMVSALKLPISNCRRN